MQVEPIDLTTILDKLKFAGLVAVSKDGYRGKFSIPKHGHLLTASELEVWMKSLGCPEWISCNDDHAWVFSITQ